MYYKAKNVDTDKALEAIKEYRKHQEMAINMKIEKERSFLEGVNKGLDIAEGIFLCSNYEKPEMPSFEDGVKETLYELGKELDIITQDVRDNLQSIDEAATIVANRIRKRVEECQRTEKLPVSQIAHGRTEKMSPENFPMTSCDGYLIIRLPDFRTTRYWLHLGGVENDKRIFDFRRNKG